MKKLISWVEIPVSDMDRAVKFYSTVFDMQLEVFECETEKMACFPTGEGALFQASGYEPSPQGTIVSLEVKDMEKAFQQISLLGGKQIMPKTKIEVEGRGYFGLFIDSEGNKVGLYSDN
ncbi:MAG: VOC family protein [Candidatus Azobacteroides sp.]|nr:VOC family protein [Candidatus Azobacteroides sp.]